MIRINGEVIQADTLPLAEYLEANHYPANGIAVEINEEILPRSQHKDCLLHSGDVVEIVSLVGGG